jgi:hypothetical protein
VKVQGRIGLAAIAAASLALPATAGATTAKKHHLDMSKVEQHVTLQAKQVKDFSVTCPNGAIAADGMWRVDEIGPYNPQVAPAGELPWTLASGVSVRAAYPDEHDVSTYRFTLRNNVSQDAQLKLFVTCLGAKTAPDTFQHKLYTYDRDTRDAAHGGDDQYVDATIHQAGFDPADANVATKLQGCKGGSIFISPGFRIDAGEAEIFASYPATNNLRQWKYGFYVQSANTDITVFGRCLDLRTSKEDGHKHELSYERRFDPVRHFDRGNGVWEHKIACDQHAKGLVGGFDVRGPESWGWNDHQRDWLGMDPRIKARAYSTLGAGGDHYLACIGDRTGKPVI